jgi:hypothetical protein
MNQSLYHIFKINASDGSILWKHKLTQEKILFNESFSLWFYKDIEMQLNSSNNVLIVQGVSTEFRIYDDRARFYRQAWNHFFKLLIAKLESERYNGSHIPFE